MTLFNKSSSTRLPALTLMELLVVLAIIGIIVLMALPNFMGVVNEARSLEAQQQLNHLYSLQKSHHIKKAKFSNSLEALRFEHAKLTTEGGNAYYAISIESSSPTAFEARAKAVLDFDGDGQFNEWSINQDHELIEIVPD